MNKSLLIWMSVFLVSLYGASAFALVNTTHPSIGENLVITLSNSTPHNGKLYYRYLFQPSWTQANVVQSGNLITATVPSVEQGIIEYVVNDSTHSYPFGGTKKYLVGHSNELLRNRSENFIVNEQNKLQYCKPYQNQNYSFHCWLANMNVLEGLRFANAYVLTGNVTYRNLSQQLIFNQYYNESLHQGGYLTAYCDQSRGDYDCGDASAFLGYTITGPKRQGQVIASLVDSYVLLGNSSILALANLYAQGSASSCDVWAGNFTCGTSDGQGALAIGYWKLYEVTENETYLSIAQNLTTAASNPIMATARALGHELTGQYDLYFEYDTCISSQCSPVTLSEAVTAFVEMYKQTGNQYYLDRASRSLRKGSTHCNPLVDDYICDNSEEQGLLNSLYSSLYWLMQNATVVNPVILGQQAVGVDVSINNHLLGYGENIDFNFVLDGTSWANDTLRYPQNISGPTQTGVYRFFYTIDGRKTPQGIVVIPDFEEHINTTANNLLASDPYRFCDPHGTNADWSDYSCNLEHFQGWMIHSLASHYILTQDPTLLSYINAMSDVTMDDVDDGYVQSTCEYANNDYTCSYIAPYAGDPNKVLGATRNAMMIISFLDSYSLTHNSTYLERALRYAYTAPQECDPWNADYDCQTPYLAYAFWRLYEVTGKFQTQAISLTAPYVATGSYTELMGSLLWKAYLLNGSSTYSTKAGTITTSFDDTCITAGSCSVEKIASRNNMYWDAFIFSKTHDTTYFDQAIQSTLYGYPEGYSQYCDTTTKTINRCYWADDHGMLSSSLAKAKSSYYFKGNRSFSVSTTAPLVVAYLDTFNVTCKAINTANFTTSMDLVLVTDQSTVLVTSPNSSSINGNVVRHTGVTYNEQRNATFTLNATYGGSSAVRCAVSTFSNSSQLTVENVSGVIDLTAHLEQFIRSNGTIEFSIQNTALFPLYNVTIDLNTTATLSNSTIIYSLLNANVTKNVTLYVNGTNDIPLFIEVNTTHGGYENISLMMYFHNDDIYNATLDFPFQRNLSTPFVIGVNITNLRNFSIYNLTINISSSLNPINTSTYQINPYTLMINMSPLGNTTVNFTLQGNSLGSFPFVVLGQPDIPDINFTLSSSVEIKEDIFDTSDSFSPPPTGDPENYELEVNITQHTNANLTNVRAEIIAGSDITITQADTTILKIKNFVAGFNATNGTNLTSVFQIIDNVTYTGLFNLSASYTHNSSYSPSTLYGYFDFNGTLEVGACTRNTSGYCIISQNTTINVTQLDYLNISYNATYARVTGDSSNQTNINFSTLEPDEIVRVQWSLSANPQREQLVYVNVTSDEGGLTTLEYIIPFTTITLGGGGGGGGGIGAPATNEKIYDYSDYSLCNVLENPEMAKLTDYNCSNIINTDVYNETKKFLRCATITRAYENDTITLDIKSDCLFRHTLYVYDVIPKNVLEDLTNVTIETNGKHKIIKRDPELLFTFVTGNAHLSYNKYLLANRLSKFEAPVILVIPKKNSEPIPSEKTINTTNDSSQPVVIPQQRVEPIIPDITLQEGATDFVEENKAPFIAIGVIIAAALLIYGISSFKFRRRLRTRKVKEKKLHVSSYQLFFSRLALFFGMTGKKNFELTASLDEYQFLKDKNDQQIMIDMYFLLKKLPVTDVFSFVKTLKIVRLGLSRLYHEEGFVKDKKRLDHLANYTQYKIKNIYTFLTDHQDFAKYVLPLIEDIQSIKIAPIRVSRKISMEEESTPEHVQKEHAKTLDIDSLEKEMYFNLMLAADTLESGDRDAAWDYFVKCSVMRGELQLRLDKEGTKRQRKVFYKNLVPASNLVEKRFR